MLRHYYTDPDTGRKVYAPGPEDEQVPWCPYCGNVRVEADDETCPACLDLQREKAADRIDSPAPGIGPEATGSGGGGGEPSPVVAPGSGFSIDLVDFTRSFFGIPKEQP
jgi:hypothetical protein